MKSHWKHGLSLICLLGVVIANIQCNNTPAASNKQTGHLKVWLTDKPFPYDLIEEANVKIAKITVRCADAEEDDDDIVSCSADEDCNDGLFCNGEETCLDGVCIAGEAQCTADGEFCDEESDSCTDTDPGDGDGDPVVDACPFITVYSGEKWFNLLELQNGATDLLVDAEIPSGMYNQMRVYVTEGKVILKDEAGEFNLKVPSGAQSGIKLNFDFEIGGEDTELLLDFDLSRAFKPIPGSAWSSRKTFANSSFRRRWLCV